MKYPKQSCRDENKFNRLADGKMETLWSAQVMPVKIM